MSFHLFGAVLTAEGIAANNRGENAGNVSTLQKIIRNGQVFTTVSAEAIRYAMREYWTQSDETVNRRVSGDSNQWQDTSFQSWKQYLDDDLLGFMHPKEDTTKRRGRLELSRAISMRPWTGDTVFCAASPHSHPRGNEDPIPFAAEVHATRYQFLFALTPEDLAESGRAYKALDAIQNLRRVAGNHSRYLYEFAPEAVVLRFTHDPVPRMMYCFDETEQGTVGAAKLLNALENGDIDGGEVVVGGAPLKAACKQLQSLGATYVPGVKAAFKTIGSRMKTVLSEQTS